MQGSICLGTTVPHIHHDISHGVSFEEVFTQPLPLIVRKVINEAIGNETCGFRVGIGYKDFCAKYDS